MPSFLAPQAQIGERELDRGVQNLMADAVFATAVGALNSGVVIVAFALWLGASNTVIGLLAAIPLWTQVLQAPAISLVERLRARRRISIIALLIARTALPGMALLPFVPDRNLALGLLILLEIVHTGANAVCACSWNSWIRDLVPEQRLGRFFAQRTIWATAVGMVCSLTAGFALQSQHSASGDGDGRVFTFLYFAGFVAAMISTWRLALVPEPLMPVAQPRQSLARLLLGPLKDREFRNIIRFMASWQFAVNAATPFFTVYFVQQLDLGMGYVIAFTIVSQFANVVVLREWGRLSDRFSNKAVLNAAAPLFLACIAGMTIASQIESRWLLVAYLGLLHVVMGMAAAGVGLAANNIALKRAPRSSATAYIATNALIASAAGGLAPILAGASADFYASRELAIQVLWRDPSGVSEWFGFLISRWDFFFLFAAAMGLYALHRLTFITEEGTIRGREVVQEMIGDTRRGVRNLSSVRGLRAPFPAGSLLELHGRFREQARADRARARRKAREDETNGAGPR